MKYFFVAKTGTAKPSIESSLDSTLNSYDLLSIDERKASSIEVPDFEYDEEYNSLVADKGIIILFLFLNIKKHDIVILLYLYCFLCL